MDKDTTKRSRTALGNLAMASVANTERDPTLRSDDSIASRLLRWSDGSVVAARFNFLHPAIRVGIERIMPGYYGYALARVRHMDLIIREEASAGIESLVILGAGYDTRAYRMQELSKVKVVEVDHPATSRDKRRRLREEFGSLPENVSFVEVDFTHQDLLEVLVEEGHHEPSTETLFLLSGVSMYLPQDAMLKMFDQIAAHTSERTSILFDYIDANVLSEPGRYYGKQWVSYAKRIGEKPSFGIAAGDTESLLAAHDLTLVSDMNADELATRYLRRADGSTVARPFQFVAIAHAFASQQRPR